MKQQIKQRLDRFFNNRSSAVGISLLLLLIWISILFSSDSFLGPYILYSFIGIVAILENTRQRIFTKNIEKKGGIIFSIAFSVAIVFANYRILTPIRKNIIPVFILLIGSFLISWNALLFILRANINISKRNVITKGEARKWFWLSFMCISLIDLAALFFCYKPGFLTFDSFRQIEQNISGVYSNHHPFWHTILIKALMALGSLFSGDINDQITVYHVFQILCMAGIFSYIIMTLCQMEISRGWIALVLVVYALMPYHMLYSITMWKDILFGGMVALFVCSLYRKMKSIGSTIANYIVLVVSAFGCCLLRSNGLVAFIVSFVVFVLVLRRTERKLLLMLLSVIIVSFVLKHPVLRLLGVSQPGIIELLAIPQQQIARVIAEDAHLEEDEIEQLEKIMDIDVVKEEYKPYISDPVKLHIRGKNQEYLNEHKWDYFGLWLRLGLRYPKYYLEAWIDQTRGYWNGGYEYWSIKTSVSKNDLGIKMSKQDNFFARRLKSWVKLFLEHPAFQVFRSIGLHVWIVILCAFVCIIQKRKEGLLCVLPLTIILTLLLATPVFSEFRYAYCIFTVFPFLVLSVFKGRCKEIA